MNRKKLIDLIQQLPDNKLEEAGAILQRLVSAHPPFKPTSLKGIWKGVTITESDIAEARKEMWGNFGDKL